MGFFYELGTRGCVGYLRGLCNVLGGRDGKWVFWLMRLGVNMPRVHTALKEARVFFFSLEGSTRLLTYPEAAKE